MAPFNSFSADGPLIDVKDDQHFSFDDQGKSQFQNLQHRLTLQAAGIDGVGVYTKTRPKTSHVSDSRSVGVSRAASSEPIAVVGMAMRLPGKIRTSEDFWDLLANKKSGRVPVPENRYNSEGFYHPSGRPGSICTRHGHFLQEDVSHFDNDFFSIPPKEAGNMDPQQRMLLEVVWECMENAGQVGWQGTDMGCYVGTFGESWLDITSRDLQRPWDGQVNSTMDFALANRVSYEYDLKGPR
jgi:acyl transferase domain-containing protein